MYQFLLISHIPVTQLNSAHINYLLVLPHVLSHICPNGKHSKLSIALPVVEACHCYTETIWRQLNNLLVDVCVPLVK